MSAHDLWQERLSEYLDGELDADERAACATHIEHCASCSETLEDLRRLGGATRALASRPPERDLWPGLERELARAKVATRRPRWLLAFAAGVLVALAADVAFRALPRGSREPEHVARGGGGEGYLLLLHEPAGFVNPTDPAAHAAIVERYSRWAAELGQRCSGGEELEPAGVELHANGGGATPSPGGERIGGYFLLSVRDEAEALSLARTCPHLDQGGWIELRRIAHTDHERDG